MKNFRKTLAIFLAILTVVSAFTAYSVFATTTETGDTPAPAAEPAPVAETGNTGTATSGWAEETRNGVTAYYVDDLDDFKAFHDNSSANSWYNKKTVYLTADLDMTKATWAWTSVASFRGTLDGQGHTINLALTDSMWNNAAVNATFKNLKLTGTAISTTPNDNFAPIVFQSFTDHTMNFENIYMNMTISGTTNVGGFVSRANVKGSKVNIKNCVNESTINYASSTAGGFVGTVEAGAVVTIKNSVFAGSINNTGTAGKRFGGFVGMVGRNGVDAKGNPYTEGTVVMEDCVYTGAMTKVNEECAAMVGGVSGNLEMTRCVALVKDTTKIADTVTDYSAFFTTRDPDTVDTNSYHVNLTDCYYAGDLGAYNTVKNTLHTITIKYNGVAATSVKALTDLTVSNFKAVCPALAAKDWVVTDKTVSYGADLAVPEILPSSLAKALGSTTLSASPVDASEWFVKNNGETVAIRFLGTIKEDAAHIGAYDSVGMKMTVTLKGDEDTVLISDKKYYSNSVYEALTLDGHFVKAEDGEYVFGISMGGFRTNSTYEVTFISFATYGGVDIYDYDGATTISVVNGAIVNA